MQYLWYFYLFFLLNFIIGATASAQFYTPPPVNPLKVEEYDSAGISTVLESHDSQLMGDTIDLDTGEVHFRHIDISLKGNSNLIVEIARTLRSSDHYDEKHFRNWALDIPRISIRIPDNMVWPSNRCSGLTASPVYGFSRDQSGYSGAQLSIPNRDSSVFLDVANRSNASTTEALYFPSGAPNFSTRKFTKINCKTSSNGEYFEVITTNGETYKFDKFFSYDINKQFRDQRFATGYYADLQVAYPTEVLDVHGNWVRYEYSDSNRGPTRIYSNDGRDISITYETASSKNISSVTTNGRTWSYNQVGGLYEVTRPDGLKWKIGSSFAVTGKGGTSYGEQCTMGGTFSITHPNGVVGVFAIGKIVNFRSNVPYRLKSSGRADCLPDVFQGDLNPNSPYPTQRPDGHVNFFSAAVKEKKLILPSGQNYIWMYNYHNGNKFNHKPYIGGVGPNPETTPNFSDNSNNSNANNHVNTLKMRTVIGPTGHMTKTWFHNSFHFNEGKLIRREIYNSQSDSVPLQSESYEYPPALNIIFSAPIGLPMVSSSTNATIKSKNSYLHKKIITMDNGDVFTREYLTGLYGANEETKMYSNVSTTPRIAVTEYEHKMGAWILNLPDRVSVNNREITTAVYNPEGLKTSQTRYGQPNGAFTYHTEPTYKGALRRYTDALGRVTQAWSWKRGTPQTIHRALGTPDHITTRQFVDNNGWVTRTDDAKGNVTLYTHDNMGRLTTINPPGPLANTSIDYSFPPSGGAVQTITKGQGRTTITYDGMFRSILERSQALDTGWSSYTNTKYDGLGRTVFKSQPSTSPTHNQGVAYTYDGLGRINTETETAVNAVTQHEYISAHRRRVHRPDGTYTQYASYGYDGPGNTDYSTIYEAKPWQWLRHTHIYKNVWGETTRIRQRAPDGSKDVSQYFYYDNQRRLCRTYTPEHGATKYQYNAAWQMTAYAKGQANDNSYCGEELPNISAKVSQVYDNLGRPTLTNFTDPATADISRTYDDNSNLKTVYRDGVNWSYSYNDTDLLTRELLQIDGRSFPMNYYYNNSGHLTKRTLPRARPLEFAPDGLGRPTQATGWGHQYATGITYHASGDIAGMTYGNGQVFTRTLNNRLLPERLLSAKGNQKALDLMYSYNQNGRINSIIDGAVNGNNRSFTYDGLGQLKTASGPWGTQTNTYDALGNILSRTLGARKINLSYDGRNRLTQSADSGDTGTRGVGYDAQGNVTSLGNLAFLYDYSDQPVVVTGTANGIGPANGNYVYDGNLKRVKSVVNGKTIYNIYDRSGTLAYVEEQNVNAAGEDRYSEYLRVGGHMLGKFQYTGSRPHMKFEHTDHLGSLVSTSLWGSGNISFRERYTPFGITMDNPASMADQAGFTGHIKDKATGLNYMQARYYDPTIGRFLSIDPVDFMQTGDPRYFNRYMYAGNDPINNLDPNGEAIGKAIKFVRNTIKHNGNPIKGGADTLAGIADDLGTLADGQLNLDDASAVFSLITGLDKKDQKAIGGAAKGVKNQADKARQARQRQRRNQRRENQSRDQNGQKRTGEGSRYEGKQEGKKGPAGDRPSGPDRSNNRERNQGIDEEHSMKPKGTPRPR